MPVEAAIIAFGPMMFTAVLAYLITAIGLLWSPIAALMAWQLAPRNGFSGKREAILSVVYSIPLLLPSVILITALRQGHLSGKAIRTCYIVLHIAWLIGPVVFCWQYILLTGIDYSWLLTKGVLLGMTLMWVGSATMTAKSWSRVEHVTAEDLLSFKFIMPYTLAWGCSWGMFGYLNLLRILLDE